MKNIKYVSLFLAIMFAYISFLKNCDTPVGEEDYQPILNIDSVGVSAHDIFLPDSATIQNLGIVISPQDSGEYAYVTIYDDKSDLVFTFYVNKESFSVYKDQGLKGLLLKNRENNSSMDLATGDKQLMVSYGWQGGDLNEPKIFFKDGLGEGLACHISLTSEINRNGDFDYTLIKNGDVFTNTGEVANKKTSAYLVETIEKANRFKTKIGLIK